MAKAKAKKGVKSKALTQNKNLPTLSGFKFGQDVGKGTEGADKDSYAIPFLNVLQKMSPQCDEDDPLHVKGAKAGNFFNTVTNEMFNGKEGIVFLPCCFQRKFIRWGARGTDSGGFKGEMTPEQASELIADETVVAFEGHLYFATGKPVNPKKDDKLVDTRNHFGLLLKEDGSVVQVLMSLSSTQIKKSKQLVSLISSVKVGSPNGAVTPPTWVNRVKITTVPESNDQGSWHGVLVTLDGFIADQAVYDLGKTFHGNIVSGDVNVNYDSASGEASASNKF